MSIKSKELKPTKDNLIGTMQYDSIGRNLLLCRFVSLLNSIDEAYSIAIDSEWGSGKTFFIKQTQLIIDACNPYVETGLLNTEKENIKSVVNTNNSS